MRGKQLKIGNIRLTRNCLPLQQGSPVSTISDFSMGSAGFDEDPFKNKDPFGNGSGGSQADPFASEDPFKSNVLPFDCNNMYAVGLSTERCSCLMLIFMFNFTPPCMK